MRILRTAAILSVGTLSVGALAAADGLYVVDNAVGVNIDLPTETLHVFGDTGDARVFVQEASATAARRRLFSLENNGPPEFTLTDQTRALTWKFGTRVDNFEINRGGTGVTEMLLKGNGDLQIQGTLTQLSSREAKDRFAPVDGRVVLDKLAAMPLQFWNYKTAVEDDRHLGPMAEDFHAAFGLGEDASRLAPSDVAGVALAAIQGLHAEVEELRAERDELRGELDELRLRLDALAGSP